MRSLKDVLNQDLSSGPDEIKLKIAKALVAERSDYLFAHLVNMTTKDKKFNEELNTLQVSYTNMIKMLEEDGIVEQSGFRIFIKDNYVE